MAIFKQRDQKILSRHGFFKDQHFNFDLWPNDLKINRCHLLPIGIYCTKFGHFQAKGSRDIEQTTFFQRPEFWPTFDHATSKSIGVIYSLGASNVPSLATSSKGVKDTEWISLGQKYWANNIWSNKHLSKQQNTKSNDRRTDKWKTICSLFFKGGHKNKIELVGLSLIHIWRCRRYAVCRSRWSPYH